MFYLLAQLPMVPHPLMTGTNASTSEWPLPNIPLNNPIEFFKIYIISDFCGAVILFAQLLYTLFSQSPFQIVIIFRLQYWYTLLVLQGWMVGHSKQVV